MPDTTDCVGFRFPLDTDGQNTAYDIEYLAQQMDNAICGASTDIDQLKTDVNNRVRKAGDTMTGTLIANSTGAGIDVRRAGNAPFISWSAHPAGSPRYGYIQAENTAGLRYQVEAGTGYHRWVTGSVETMRLSAGGILDVNQVRSDVRLTAGGPSGGQLYMIDTQPVSGAPTTSIFLYHGGTVSSPTTRLGWWGWHGSNTMMLLSEINGGDIRVQTTGSGDVYLITGSGGFIGFAPNGSTKAAVVGESFLFGKNSVNLDAVGVEIYCGSGAEGAVRSTVGVLNVANFYARHEGAANVGDSYFYQCATGAGSVIGGLRSNAANTAVVLVGTATSDYRVKEELGPIEDGLERLLQLRPIRYMRNDDDTGDELDGLIAHEVAEIAPYAVRGEKDAMQANGAPDLQDMYGDRLVPLLIAAVQELNAVVVGLIVKVRELEENCCG